MKIHPNSNIACDYTIGEQWSNNDNTDRRTIGDLLVTFVDYAQATMPVANDGVGWLNTAQNNYQVYLGGAGSFSGWRIYSALGLTLHGRGALAGKHYLQTTHGFTEVDALVTQINALQTKSNRLLAVKPNFVAYGRIGGTIGLNQNLLNFGFGYSGFTGLTTQYNQTFSSTSANKIVFTVSGFYQINFRNLVVASGQARALGIRVVVNSLQLIFSYDSKTSVSNQDLMLRCDGKISVPAGAELYVIKDTDADVFSTVHNEYYLEITYLGDNA